MANKKRARNEIPNFDLHASGVSISIFWSEILQQYDVCIGNSALSSSDSIVQKVSPGLASKLISFIKKCNEHGK